jgi:hypothetical protein
MQVNSWVGLYMRATCLAISRVVNSPHAVNVELIEKPGLGIATIKIFRKPQRKESVAPVV